MKLSNIKDTADVIIHNLNHLESNPLDPKYSRDLLAILNREIDDISELTTRQVEQLDKFIKKEKKYALHLKKIYQGETSLDIPPQASHMNKLKAVLSSRFTYIKGTPYDYTKSAATVFSHPWIKLGNMCSRLSNQSTLRALQVSGALDIPPMSIRFQKYIAEKIKALLLSHMQLPFNTPTDHAAWDRCVQVWTDSILQDKQWSNEDLSYLYWSSIEHTHFIDFMIPLSCHPSAQFRVKAMHCLAFWLCHVMPDGYEHIRELYSNNRSILPTNLLLIRDNNTVFKNEKNIFHWIELARFLNSSGLRAEEQSILSSTHKAIFNMVAQGYRFNEYYGAFTREAEDELTHNMEVHFFNFYHEVYARLSIEERSRLDSHRIIQPGICKTFGALIQEAIGPRTRFLHVLQSIPHDLFGMEMDYILVTDHLYYVNYIDRKLEPVTLVDIAVLKNGIRKAKQFKSSITDSGYKIRFDSDSVKALVTDNGGHAPQKISQACMNNFFKNILPLLIDYDPFVVFPRCIEVLTDPADYFDYCAEEQEDLWGISSPPLLRRLRYHSAQKIYRDYEGLDLVKLRSDITNVIAVLLAYPFVDVSCILKFNKLPYENRGPKEALELLSMINAVMTTNADPRFMISCLSASKLEALITQARAIEIPLDMWDSLSYLLSMGNNYSSVYDERVAAKNDTVSFLSALNQWPNIDQLKLKIGRDKFNDLKKSISSHVPNVTASANSFTEESLGAVHGGASAGLVHNIGLFSSTPDRQHFTAPTRDALGAVNTHALSNNRVGGR